MDAGVEPIRVLAPLATGRGPVDDTVERSDAPGRPKAGSDPFVPMTRRAGASGKPILASSRVDDDAAAGAGRFA